MTRPAKRRDDVSPSLFPFLAVLLCTMGALVLILMLTVSGAQNTAQQMASELEEKVELEEAKIQLVKEGLTEKLEEAKIEVEKKRLALQNLEEHIRELTQELEQLVRQKEVADASSDPSSIQDTDREEVISELEKQLAEANKELQQKLDDPKGDKPIFAIIPYDGPNGTHRRPIYLECTNQGVVIQPEGVVISPSDLRPPYGPGNPLDAALRAIRAEFPSKTGSVTSNPYPLLVVRPSGIKHYMMARAAMTGWDDQFGYELVSEELDLAYPPSLPHLPEKIAQALDLARQRQAALVQAMPQHYAGLEPLSSDLTYASQGNSAGDLASDPSDSLFREGEGQLASDTTASSDGISSTQPATFTIGSQSGSLRGSNSLAGGENSRQNEFRAGVAGSSSTFSEQPNSSATGNQYSQTGSLLNSSGEIAGSLRNTRGGSESGSGFGSGSQPGEFGNPGPPFGSGPSNGQSASSTSVAGYAGNGDSNGNSSTNNSGGSGGGSDMAAASSASSIQSPVPGSLSSSNLSSGGTDQMMQNSVAGSMTSSANGANKRPASKTASGSTGSTSTGSMSASAGQADGDCGPDCQNPNMDPNQSMPSNLNVNLNRNQQEIAKPLALARGANWAWDRPQRTQTAVVRAIRVRCFSDRWEVPPEKGSSRNPVIIGFNNLPAQRAEELAKVVRKRVENWGVALAGGHWTPVLHVDVASDAEWRFTQLQRLMEGSGIDVQRKNTISPPAN